MELSYLPLANLMRLCWLWECDYGLAAEYRTFFGLSPMPEAGVITNKEQYESWRFLKEYAEILDHAGAELPRGVDRLVDAFVMYTPQVLRYALPPFLPPEAVSREPTVYNSVNVDSFYIPLEDLRDGWEKSGKLGQQLYGAGSPLAFAAATVSSIGATPSEAAVPEYFALHQNFPNPFNAATAFRFDIGGREKVATTLKVYNVMGQQVAVILDEECLPGRYTLRWDARDEKGQPLPSGVYVVALRAGKFHQARNVLLLR